MAEPPSTYESHRRKQADEARKAHAEWVANLSGPERARLKSADLLDYSDDDGDVGGHSPWSPGDIADSDLASYIPDDPTDSPEAEIADAFGIPIETARRILEWHREKVADAIRGQLAHQLSLIVGGLLSSRNAKLSAAGLAFAANLAALNGLGCQRTFAKRIRVSPQAVSKVVGAWRDMLHLKPSVHQKSEEARKAYSAKGFQDHWRHRKAAPATSATDLLARLSKQQSSN